VGACVRIDPHGPDQRRVRDLTEAEVWLALTFLVLAALAYFFEFAGTMASTYLGGFRGLIPYVVGGWVLLVVASFWYVGRLEDEEGISSR
jgi:hypothetical protein